MRRFYLLSIPLLFVALAAPAWAQDEPAKPDASTPAAANDDADAAREALKEKEEDVDTKELLKETLTAREKQYSLLKQGTFDSTYSFNYSYVGGQRLDTSVDNLGNLTQFQVVSDAAHTLTHTISVDYGLLNSLTVGIGIPLVSKFTDVQTGDSTIHNIGDLTANVRWQPIGLEHGLPTVTLSGSLTLPTGQSPYEIVIDKDLSTGGGQYALSVGANASKVVDPVVLFGSASVGYQFGVDGFQQIRGNATLEQVGPTESLNFSFGMGYALSYDISTSMSFSYGFTRSAEFSFADGRTAETANQTGASMSFGVGWRLAPKYLLNTSVGFGLTSNTSDFSIRVSLPIRF